MQHVTPETISVSACRFLHFHFLCLWIINWANPPPIVDGGPIVAQARRNFSREGEIGLVIFSENVKTRMKIFAYLTSWAECHVRVNSSKRTPKYFSKHFVAWAIFQFRILFCRRFWRFHRVQRAKAFKRNLHSAKDVSLRVEMTQFYIFKNPKKWPRVEWRLIPFRVA